MPGDEQICRPGEGHEGALVIDGVGTEFVEVEAAVPTPAVVVLQVEVGEDGLAEILAEVVHRVHLADAHGLEDFARAISDAAVAGQGNLGGGSEADFGEVAFHLLAVRAVDGAG